MTVINSNFQVRPSRGSAQRQPLSGQWRFQVGSFRVQPLSQARLSPTHGELPSGPGPRLMGEIGDPPAVGHAVGEQCHWQSDFRSRSSLSELPAWKFTGSSTPLSEAHRVFLGFEVPLGAARQRPDSRASEAGGHWIPRLRRRLRGSSRRSDATGRSAPGPTSGGHPVSLTWQEPPPEQCHWQCLSHHDVGRSASRLTVVKLLRSTQGRQIPAQAWLSTTRSCAPSQPGLGNLQAWQASPALSQVEKGKPCWSNRIPRHRRLVEWELPPDDAIYILVQLGRGVVPRQMFMQRSAQHVRLPANLGSPCPMTTWPAMQHRLCHGSLIEFPQFSMRFSEQLQHILITMCQVWARRVSQQFAR